MRSGPPGSRPSETAAGRVRDRSSIRSTSPEALAQLQRNTMLQFTGPLFCRQRARRNYPDNKRRAQFELQRRASALYKRCLGGTMCLFTPPSYRCRLAISLCWTRCSRSTLRAELRTKRTGTADTLTVWSQPAPSHRAPALPVDTETECISSKIRACLSARPAICTF